MSDNYKELIAFLGESKVLLDEPLNKYSSFHIGGPADIFFKARTCDELVKAVTSAWRLKIPVFVISGGTNLLVGDYGYRGLVVKNETNSIKLVGVVGGRKSKSSTKVHTAILGVETGVGINRLVRYTLDQGFSGLAAFLGQPGCVGGAVWNNAHNMKTGNFFGDNVFGAKILQPSGKVVDVSKSYFKFGYDQSIIQKTHDIVLSVLLKLNAGDKKSLWEEAQKALEYRRQTQPVGVFSSGCTFRNIKKSDAIRIATPSYTCSAGYLIESVGLKGYQIGDAHFSSSHANFILNKGNSKARDVLALINLAKKKVKEKYKLDLKEEIVLVGAF